MPNDQDIVKAILDDVHKNCLSYNYSFTPESPKAIADRISRLMEKAIRPYIEGGGIKYDRGDNAIVITDESCFNSEWLPMLPIVLDGVDWKGTYELKVGEKLIGKIVYNGPVEPPTGDQTIMVGAKTTVQFYEKIKMIDIEINVGGDGET